MTRALSFVASAAATALLLLACSNERIVLATSEVGVDGGDGTVQVTKCTDNDDCPPNTFCEREHCNSPAGTCAFIPAACHDNSESPKCGCDGVTYFNDCVRKLHGVSAADEGECIYRAQTCDSNGQGCGKNLYCAQLGPFGDPLTCHAMTGRCWGLPTVCPPPGDDLWDECSGDPNALHCVDTCNAIRSGKTFVAAMVCP